MAEAISSHRGSSAAVVADKLHSDFLSWMGTQDRRDDVCALVLGL